MDEFKKLGVSEAILRVLHEEGISTPTEIQLKTIPLVLGGKDVIAGSATGSGKTLVFGCGIIPAVRRNGGIQALVLTPTRELAQQVEGALVKFSKYSPIRACVVYGGVSINRQIQELRYCDIVVGTPGRILDHIQRRTINLSGVKVLVLDEADRMFEMGMIEDVREIIRQCPRERQTMLFSATIYQEVVELSRDYMHNAIQVSAEQYVDPSKLSQIYYEVPNNRKIGLLVHLLKNERSGLVMVFCNTRKRVDFVAKNLLANGIEAKAIHGGYSQARRTRTLDHFHSKKMHVLVCTDVAARGLDIPHVSHVYNYDIPRESKEYVHRIGRTARAGKEGKVVNILSPDGYENFGKVLYDTRIEVKKEEMPHVGRVIIKMESRPPRSGGRDRGLRGNRRFGGRGR
jgi:superfamily II DNA/RNA helicase